MRPQRTNTREIHLGASTHFSASPPVHRLTQPYCAGLPRSSPPPLPGSGTGLRATHRAEKFVTGSDFLRSQLQQCLDTLRDFPLSSTIKRGTSLLGTGQITNTNHRKIPMMLSAVLTHSKIQPTGKQKHEKRCYSPCLSSSFSWGVEGEEEEDARN